MDNFKFLMDAFWRTGFSEAERKAVQSDSQFKAAAALGNIEKAQDIACALVDQIRHGKDDDSLKHKNNSRPPGRHR